ncbi:MAG: hypothetical protein ABI585_00045 [Betaproteobacteria bacterium]
MLRAFAGMSLVLLLLAGCTPKDAATGGASGVSTFAVVAVPVDPTKKFDRVVCNADAVGKTRCLVSILPTIDGAGNCTVEAPHIEFDKPDRRFVVAWRPTAADAVTEDPKFRFCPLLGDGVWFKDPVASNDEQFDENWASDSAGDLLGDNASFANKDCYKRARVWAGNKKTGASYAYKMQFHYKPTGAVCKVDPFIKNG